ncbi:MAG TPA: nucleotide pyrophosphatase, partial [Bacillota bacterium]|nr:nucleotide pyrophosphatase [Bacillota bacterium]
YDVIITADHGMDALGEHGGSTDAHRDVALYIISDQVEKGDFTGEYTSQLQIAPLCCALMGVEAGARMRLPNQIRGCR